MSPCVCNNDGVLGMREKKWWGASTCPVESVRGRRGMFYQIRAGFVAAGVGFGYVRWLGLDCALECMHCSSTGAMWRAGELEWYCSAHTLRELACQSRVTHLMPV
jgi:hypothetical protein